jgi:Na+-driven multidrug efflux pump
MGLAITTVVARCVGAQEYEQQKHYAAQMIQLAFA